MEKIYSDSNKLGEVIYQELHQAVNDLISGSTDQERKNFIKKLEKATSFLAAARLASPAKGISRLLEAHVMSHTARGAVMRCEELTHLIALEKVSEERMTI